MLTSFQKELRLDENQEKNLDSCFVSYIKAINPKLTCRHFDIEKEYFPMLYIPNKGKAPYAYWTSYGNDLIIGVSQNLLFSDYSDSMESFDFFAYSKGKQEFLLFNHNNQEEISCRRSVCIIDIIPRSHNCKIFDSDFKIKANVDFQFLMPKSPVSCVFFKEVDGKRFSHPTRITELDEYHGALYKLIHIESLKAFIDRILAVPTLYKIPDDQWKIDKGNSPVIYRIERAKRDSRSCE
jgi:hypothetical protein